MTHLDMQEKQNIFRSASLNDLKVRTKPDKNLVVEFRDDTSAVNTKGNKLQNLQSHSYSEEHITKSRNQASNETLLKDLDNILRTKLNLSNNMLHGKLDNEVLLQNNIPSKYKASPILNQRFTPTRQKNTHINNSYESSNMENEMDLLPNVDSNGALTTSDADSEDDGNVVEEQEDEAFANVDEIDGPITPNQLSPKEDKTKFPLKHDVSVSNESISPINHAKRNIIDYNMPVDEEFQKNLDRRASEILDEEGIKHVTKPKIQWSLKDFYNLQDELAEWFTAADYCQLGQLKSAFKQRISNPTQFIQDIDFRKNMISEIFQNFDSNVVSNIQVLTYISMGTCGLVENVDMNLEMIRQNNLMFIDYLPTLIELFQQQALNCQNDNRNLRKKTVLLFYTSTILFYVINTCIDQREKSNQEISQAIVHIYEKRLMKFLTKYIEHWRWNSRLSMRIRNMILLLFKTTVLQFGNERVYQDTKKKIYRYHGLKKNSNKDRNLTISPLHYEAFREDIISRFPNLKLPETDIPNSVDDSNSLAQFLEIPRSKSRSVINASLAVPEKHLSTPFPSPPPSPVLLQYNDGMRPRKSFQTNMSYPQLYPIDTINTDCLAKTIFNPDDLNGGSSDLEHLTNIPYSIEEASKILSDNIEIKLSTKQLWYERNLFMSRERGWTKDTDITKIEQNPYNYMLLDWKNEPEELQIMNRIDTYYMDCLSNFNSLIFVLLQTIETNLSNVEYKCKGNTSDYDTSLIQSQLEITRSKEILMRSCSGILTLLLKWFKLNHVLKYEHFASLIYDFRYINTCTSILSKYCETYPDKVFNRTIEPNHNIWRECSQSNEAYSESFEKDHNAATSLHGNSEYNNVILSSFTNLLKVLRQITGNKTHRLKSLPLSIGFLFKSYYKMFILDMYHPMLKIIKELTPFKNKRWKSEHMDLISGVFLYEKLELIDNWVTGKDIAGELNDASGQEIALRALLQFYNFTHYKYSMGELGYAQNSDSNIDIRSVEDAYSSI